jgi:hypothetical protein
MQTPLCAQATLFPAAMHIETSASRRPSRKRALASYKSLRSEIIARKPPYPPCVLRQPHIFSSIHTYPSSRDMAEAAATVGIWLAGLGCKAVYRLTITAQYKAGVSKLTCAIAYVDDVREDISNHHIEQFEFEKAK